MNAALGCERPWAGTALRSRQTPRRAMTLLGLLAATLACTSSSRVAQAHAVGPQPSWRFAPAEAPPPPAGVAPAPYGVPVGQVGQISFWAPNRGLLIEGGSSDYAGSKFAEAVPPGLYAYNGASWHLLSNQCGGREGRIAWAGPEEFWTISDQRGGQDLPELYRADLRSLSLCHFLDGQIVGSYAMPLGQPDSYLHMDAAACEGPDNCWFGGEAGSGENPGSFHLHWDGASVTAAYDNEEAHSVTGMVDYAGQLLESVQMRGGGIPGEPPVPALIHTIVPIDSAPFNPLYLFSPETGKPVPKYEPSEPPYTPEELTLATDGTPLGSEDTQLWALANPPVRDQSPTVLRCVAAACLEGRWSQLMPTASLSLPGIHVEAPAAPEPGSEDAWVSVQSPSGGETATELLKLGPQGVLSRVSLPEADEAEVGSRGTAGPIACPAPGDCWMATANGWLYHYTDGAQLPLDGDPNFAGVITYRPLDAGSAQLYPTEFTETGNASSPPATLSPPPTRRVQPPRRHKGRRLVTHLHGRFVRRDRFVITFTLTSVARVGLVARLGKRVVARVPTRTLRAGRHTLGFAFDPLHPPTKLRFSAAPLRRGKAGGEETIGGGAGNSLET